MQKNKLSSCSKNSIIIIAAISAVLLTALRVVILRFFTDASTGFITKAQGVNIVFCILLVVSLVCVIILSKFSDDMKVFSLSGTKSKLWICDLLLSFGFLLDVLSTYNTQSKYIDYTMTASAQNVVIFCGYLRMLFALISCLYFIVSAVDKMRGGDASGKLRTLVLAAPIWVALRLVPLFTTQISFIRVGELVLKMLSLIFLALFLYALAQQKSKVYNEGNEWKLFGYGLSAFITLLISAVPKLIFVFAASGEFNNNSYSFDFIDIIFALYILFICLSNNVISAHAKQEVEEETTDKFNN